jgi:hypothetical protein
VAYHYPAFPAQQSPPPPSSSSPPPPPLTRGAAARLAADVAEGVEIFLKPSPPA